MKHPNEKHLNHSDNNSSLHHPRMGGERSSMCQTSLEEFWHLFTLRRSCSPHHRGLIRFRISDRKFVNQTTEMILWSMILDYKKIRHLFWCTVKYKFFWKFSNKHSLSFNQHNIPKIVDVLSTSQPLPVSILLRRWQTFADQSHRWWLRHLLSLSTSFDTTCIKRSDNCFKVLYPVDLFKDFHAWWGKSK